MKLDGQKLKNRWVKLKNRREKIENHTGKIRRGKKLKIRGEKLKMIWGKLKIKGVRCPNTIFFWGAKIQLFCITPENLNMRKKNMMENTPM